MTEYNSLMSKIGLRSHKLQSSKINRPRQYSFDLSGKGDIIIEPEIREYDLSNETIFSQKMTGFHLILKGLKIFFPK